MARFCASLHDRRRSGPVIICIRAISMSLHRCKHQRLHRCGPQALEAGLAPGGLPRRVTPILSSRKVLLRAIARRAPLCGSPDWYGKSLMRTRTLANADISAKLAGVLSVRLIDAAAQDKNPVAAASRVQRSSTT